MCSSPPPTPSEMLWNWTRPFRQTDTQTQRRRWRQTQRGELCFLISPHEGEQLIHFKKRTLWTRFNTLVRNAVNETVKDITASDLVDCLLISLAYFLIFCSQVQYPNLECDNPLQNLMIISKGERNRWASHHNMVMFWHYCLPWSEKTGKSMPLKLLSDVTMWFKVIEWIFMFSSVWDAVMIPSVID